MVPLQSGWGVYHQSLYGKDRYHSTMNYLLQSEVKATHFTMCNIQNVSRKYTQLEIHTQHENETCKNKNEESKKPWQVTVIEPQLFQMQVC